MADNATEGTRAQALEEEAASEARRMAQVWRQEAEDNHSSHHSDLRRTWADAAEQVADAIAALAKGGGASA